MINIVIGKVLIFLILTGLLTSWVYAEEHCDSLAKLTLKDTVITSAKWVARPSLLADNLGDLAGKPNALNTQAVQLSQPFCRVTATIKPTAKSNINIEVWLPAAKVWNGRYLGTGNGGSGGRMWYRLLASGVDLGYATAHTDMGTKTATEHTTLDFDFGINEPEKITDWAYRSTHLMTLAAKKLITHYYKKSAEYNYFYGCSTGGHQGLAEAQKYPADYDGIIAIAPALNRINLHARFLWASNVAHSVAGSLLSPKEKSLLNTAALQSCDSVDGLVDGLIDDPRRCQFSPELLLCDAESSSASGKHCLNKKQIAVAQELYRGYDNKELSRQGTAEKLFVGITPGSEADLEWLDKPYHETFGKAGGLLAWFDIVEWTNQGADFDFEADTQRINNEISPLLNYNNTDLSTFSERGGKLILAHGLADGLIPAQHSMNYYDQVEKRVGDRKVVQQFVRLFTLPGMHHCSGGPGPDRFDSLAALERWVESDSPPQNIIATKLDVNAPARTVINTRLVCPYPQVARWKGVGTINDASNFSCINL